MDPLAQIFMDKPELVWPLPDWMLPAARLEALRGKDGLAVVELAGRDSVAAALKAVAQGGISVLLPTYVYTGTEFGPWAMVGQARERLASALPAGVELLPLAVFGAPRLWQALSGRFLTTLQDRYGFCLSCVGCHLYLHAMRLPLALALGGAAIIAGERESHDGRVKINQMAVCLDAYQELTRGFGVELRLPLRHMASGREVEALLGLAWAEGGDQLGCVLSGNYNDPGGRARFEPQRLADYLRDFAMALTRRVMEAHVAGLHPDPLALAAEIIPE